MELGNCYDFIGDSDNAEKKYREVFKIAKQTGNKDGEISYYINCGILYYNKSD